jgi:hypothetical protein
MKTKASAGIIDRENVVCESIGKGDFAQACSVNVSSELDRNTYTFVDHHKDPSIPASARTQNKNTDNISSDARN